MMIQMAKIFGIRTIGVIRREEQKKELLEAGADEVLVASGESDGEDIAARVKEITKDQGAYGAIDAVAGVMTQRLLAAVRPKGTLLVYGLMSGLTFSGSILDVLIELKVITGFHIDKWKQSCGREKHQKLLKEVMDMFAEGKVTGVVGETFPLESVAEAVQATTKAGKKGKVLLKD
ncbi:hypothetical protein WJX73_010431 [Symbiochloris irregularis]